MLREPRNPYDEIADIWHQQDRGFRAQAYVDRVIVNLEAGDHVLDLGCGTGIPIARYLFNHGFRVTGVDSSARMIAIAREALPGAEFIHSDMLRLPPTEPAAAIFAWDSIFHIDRQQHAALFAQLRKRLIDGGWLMMSAGGSSDPGFTSEMYGHTFYYSGHAPEETITLLEQSGFFIDFWEVDDPSSRGHIAIIARAKTSQGIS